jgi:hypothetical protein
MTDLINYYTFEDKYSQQEITKSEGSVFYKAFGVIISINVELVSQNKDGIMVCYRSPKGDLKREFRSIQELELQKVDKDTWEVLKDLIQGSKLTESKELYKFIFKTDGNLPQQSQDHPDRNRQIQ